MGRAEAGAVVLEVGKGGNAERKEASFSRLFAPFPGISHLFPLKFFKAMNRHDISAEPTPCPLPRVGTRGRWSDCWAILPRAAPKQHGATTGLNAATSLRLGKCAMLRAAVWIYAGKITGFLASQARHEMGAQKGRSLARNVVAMLRIVTGGTNFLIRKP